MNIPVNFKGQAKPLDDIDIPHIGARIGVGEDEVHAFIDVETRGSGFDSQKRPRILFERHKFYKHLKHDSRKLNRALKAGLANKRAGGYGKESIQYNKLARAMAIDVHAAYMACSWGLGQIMGFNHKLAGYVTVELMIADFCNDEEAQLNAAITFIINTGIAKHLRSHNWAAFARGYNGSGYRRNSYDVKLRNSFAKWKRIKNTTYSKARYDAINSPAVDYPINDAPTKPKKKVPVKTAIGAAIVAAIAWWWDGVKEFMSALF